MKLVVLDGYALNPGDLNWGGIEGLASCTVYDRTSPELVVERVGNAELVLTNKTILNRPILEKLPQLRYIGVLATGVNVIDLDFAKERGITVTNVPGYGSSSVAQMVFALLLEMTMQVGHHSALVCNGVWTRSPDFSFWDRPLVELDGLTMGIIGFGRIGQHVARIAKTFGMQVLIHTPHPKKNLQVTKSLDLEFVDIERLFKESDVISLHCPLTEETAGLVNASRLSLIKQTAYLINTGRGQLVDEESLAEALNEGRLAGAGLDVLSSEPPLADNPLLSARNCFITPHIAWATRAARERLMTIVTDNLASFLTGQPQNRVV